MAQDNPKHSGYVRWNHRTVVRKTWALQVHRAGDKTGCSAHRPPRVHAHGIRLPRPYGMP